jgi:hypothetical protein
MGFHLRHEGQSLLEFTEEDEVVDAFQRVVGRFGGAGEFPEGLGTVDVAPEIKLPRCIKCGSFFPFFRL